MLRAAIRSASRLLRGKPAPTYNETHVNQACDRAGGVSGKSVLVVGCAGGSDCRLFVEHGAASVVGLDVHPAIGSEFAHARVGYTLAPVEQSGLPSATFDLVFATATMEHVHNIEAGFSEMVRLTKAGGTIFSIAAPLWNSPYGHHMGCFDGHPWVHLALPENAICSYARDHGITHNDGVPIESVVRYMMHPDFFNRRPAADYAAAIERLDGLKRVKSILHRETDRRLLEHPLGRTALAILPEAELMSVTHQFSATRAR